MERTLYSVSKPVVQGAISTLLGVVGMLYAPSEAFVIFFKMIFVVITLGVFHSLVLIPTFLTFVLDVMETVSMRCGKSSSSSYSVDSNSISGDHHDHDHDHDHSDDCSDMSDSSSVESGKGMAIDHLKTGVYVNEAFLEESKFDAITYM